MRQGMLWHDNHLKKRGYQKLRAKTSIQNFIPISVRLLPWRFRRNRLVRVEEAPPRSREETISSGMTRRRATACVSSHREPPFFCGCILQATDAPIPPNFALNLSKVAAERPRLRQASAVFAPAACSFSIPMICASVNRDGRFASRHDRRTLSKSEGSSGSQVSWTPALTGSPPSPWEAWHLWRLCCASDGPESGLLWWPTANSVADFRTADGVILQRGLARGRSACRSYRRYWRG